jgi:hypothetical protein
MDDSIGAVWNRSLSHFMYIYIDINIDINIHTKVSGTDVEVGNMGIGSISLIP